MPDPQLAAIRHMGVLPSFAVKHITKNIQSLLFKNVTKHDLLYWTELASPTNEAEDEMRINFHRHMLRLKNKAYLDEPVNVYLVDQWNAKLSEPCVELEIFLCVKRTDKPFDKHSIHELADGLGMKAMQVLKLLAKLEALYWVANPSVVQPKMGGGERLFPITKAFAKKLYLVLDEPWVSDLSTDDLRFPQPGDLPVKQWILSLLKNGKVMPASALDYAKRMIEAQEASWEEELEQINAFLLPGGVIKFAMPPFYFIRSMYFTKEYVSQHKLVTTTKISHSPVERGLRFFISTLLKRKTQMPSLTRLIKAAFDLAPMNSVEMTSILHPLLGQSSGVEGALRFAHKIGFAKNLRMQSMPSKKYTMISRAVSPRKSTAAGRVSSSTLAVL